MTTAWRRIAPLIATALVLAGCAGGGGGTSPAAAPASATPGAGPTTEPGAAPSAAPGGGTVARCHTANLKVTTKPDPGGGAAGTTGLWLEFTNTSAQPCTMYGFPGVSFESAGKQVNDPAKRTPTRPARVTVPPGGSAHAVVLIHNPDNYADGCAKTRVDGFRVYPPDETASVLVSSPQQACAAKGLGVPDVNPVEAGGS